MKVYRAALIGIGGFGVQHVNILQKLAAESCLRVVAFADPNFAASRKSCDTLTAMGAVPYKDYVEMLTLHSDIDFVAIVTPIATHKPICIQVMRMGFHVLVEKPPSVTIQDMDEIIAARRETGRLCQVNFQNTSGQAFRTLLERLGSGALGQVEHVVGVGMWKRPRTYYDRTRWAGKLVSDGHYVLDGTFTNPFAHLLHNCLLAAGAGDVSGASYPQSVQAELYRVNDIEGDDVSCIRTEMANGASVHFYAMLCHEADEVPCVTVYGTQGEAHWNYQNKLTIRARGSEEELAYGPSDLMRGMYLNLMEAIATPDKPLYSPVEACRSFVLAANGAYESARSVTPIPSRFVTEREDGGSTVRLLPSLSAGIRDAAAKRQLYSEYSFPWAAPTHPFKVEGYSAFELPAGMAFK